MGKIKDLMGSIRGIAILLMVAGIVVITLAIIGSVT
jgi:hypothetical protein